MQPMYDFRQTAKLLKNVFFVCCILAVLVGLIVSADSAQEKRDTRAATMNEAMRANYTSTGFCPRCNGPHWLPTAGAPKPCPICNPRGSLEVLD